MTKNANEPANPIVAGHMVECLGLTKREHFAGLAMAAILETKLPRINLPGLDTHSVANLAKLAVLAADTLLEELEKPVDNAK